MRVAVVTVGDELLAGDTVNTNAAWLGRQLTERGASVERTSVVPDRIADIARVVADHREAYDAVLVTGGLGPTHDDVTMAAVAKAFDRDLEPNQAALEWLEDEGGYAHEDLAAGTVELPEGARPLHNEVGVAPGCVIDQVYVLPGVPEEMEAMFGCILDAFEGQRRHVVQVETPEPESALLDRLRELQERFDVTVGSYPGETVRIKIESTDSDEADAAGAWLRDRVESTPAEE